MLKKKLFKSAKWLYEELVLTCAWTLVYSLILEDEDVFFPFMVIDCANVYGATIALLITVISTETLGILIKRMGNTIKEIKG